MIEDLRILPALDDDDLIEGLKDGLPAYFYYAKRTFSRELNLLQWWYDHSSVRPEDCSPGSRCIMCGCVDSCKCNAGLGWWWKAMERLAVVQPSSAGAERVFSVLGAFWNQLQTNTLSDTILVSLLLAINGRDL